MKKKDIYFEIDPSHPPKVLLLGNGMLKLSDEGISWEELLRKIKSRDGDIKVKGIPYAMQPEAMCGVDVENIQHSVAGKLQTATEIHPLLKELLQIPFDAYITTNYTYEIEAVISKKKWTDKSRKNAFIALSGSAHVNHNTFVCNAIETKDGRIIPVFHIHGEAKRKRSMVLSYYSYANSVMQLADYNKNTLRNKLFVHRQKNEKLKCKCWLDYFLAGDVWSVGFGLDVSEFDVWWAIERKAREKAEHGLFKAYFDGKEGSVTPQSVLLDAMMSKYQYIPVYNNNYVRMYEKVIEDIKRDFSCSNKE